jgi:flagellar hook-length control protein FliK
MTDESKISSTFENSESKLILSDDISKKRVLRKNDKKDDFEKTLNQIKLLLLEGKFFANNGNSEFNETQGQKIITIKDGRLLENGDSNNEEKKLKEDSTDDLSLAEVLSQSSAVTETSSTLNVVDVGLNTTVITSGLKKIEEAQLLQYAKKTGLDPEAIKLLFKSVSKEEKSDKGLILDSIKNLSSKSDFKPNQTEQFELSQKKPNIHKIEVLNKGAGVDAQKTLISDTETTLRVDKKPIDTRTNYSDGRTNNSDGRFKLSNTATNSDEEFKTNMKENNEQDLTKIKLKILEGENSLVSKKQNNPEVVDLEKNLRDLVNSINKSSKSPETTKELIQNNQTAQTNGSGLNSSFSNSQNESNNQNSNSHREAFQSSNEIKRYEQYQKLAEKLAENVAKKIISQINKGEWKINLSLRPKTLGTIEIELTLKGKQLDATFNVNQAFTRDLLQEASPKLKESLEKSGIDVASVDINHKKHNEHDGKQTKNMNYEVSESVGKGNQAAGSERSIDKEKQIISANELNVLV